MINIKSEPIFKLKNPKALFFLPPYVFNHFERKISYLKYFYYSFLVFLIKLLVRLRLRILTGSYKSYLTDQHLTNEEIENIYKREAITYENRHHLTTNFRDTWWRRQIGLDIVSFFHRNKSFLKINILDIATGVGLSMEEMFQIFKIFNIKVKSVGLDYNENMLDQARKNTLARMKNKNLLVAGIRDVEFLRGDARKLINDINSPKDLTTFNKNEFDCISIMFGIGGIDEPINSFKQQLLILKEGGILSMIDIHRPLEGLEDKWPFYIPRRDSEVFSYIAWENATRPLVLRTLWGWRDPTKLFYLLQLISVEDSGEHYGFELHSFILNNEFWWLRLPVMTTAKIIVRKMKISTEEHLRRLEIINQLSENI